MLIIPAKGLSLVAADALPALAVSEIFAVGNANKLDLALKIHTAFIVSVGGQARVEYYVKGSMTGQDWFTLPGLSGYETAPGVFDYSESFSTPYVQFTFSLALAGSVPGDWGAAVLDAHVNLTRVG